MKLDAVFPQTEIGADQAAIRAFVQAWGDLGATHLGVITMGAGFTTVDEHIAALREFKATMG